MKNDARTQAAVDAGHAEWAELPATAAEAKIAGVPQYFTGKSCGRDHTAPRFRSSRDCVMCDGENGRSLHQREWFRSYRRPYEANRRALKLEATPTWLTPAHFDAMRSTYDEAALLTRETGIPHQVDHIIPLRHALVCGLHVPWNLQVLTASTNKSKNNSFDGTMQNEGWRA